MGYESPVQKVVEGHQEYIIEKNWRKIPEEIPSWPDIIHVCKPNQNTT